MKDKDAEIQKLKTKLKDLQMENTSLKNEISELRAEIRKIRPISEKKAEVIKAIKNPNNADKTNREIARECKVSHPYVAIIRRKIEEGIL